MRSSEDFRRATRHGVRAGRTTLVVHAVRTLGDGVHVGFVVGRPVGPAVVRNRVKRRLRHLAATQLESTPTGVDVVVRALPAAAMAQESLATDLGSAWQRALQRLPAALDDTHRP
jgi:ribonuclease P protein component